MRVLAAVLLAAAVDSITYTWTTPSTLQDGAAAHSWMTTELWFAAQFTPGWPVQWHPVRIYVGPSVAPGTPCSVRLPAPGWGSVFPIAVGPGRSSPRGNCADGRLR